MKLKQLGKNQTEVQVCGLIILYSYDSPVAYIDTYSGYTQRLDESACTPTTHRHIVQWLQSREKQLPLIGFIDNVAENEIRRAIQTAITETQ